jgi:hypothetical protein
MGGGGGSQFEINSKRHIALSPLECLYQFGDGVQPQSLIH